MNLIISNNHFLVNLQTNNKKELFIIDSGSPISFAVDEDIKSVLINNKKHNLKQCPNLSIKDITNRLTDKDVKGFIGMDILEKTGLTIDFKNNEVEFSSKVGGHVLAFLNNSIDQYRTTKDIVINHNILNNTYIDTGACISYVSEKYLKEENRTNEKYHDLNPLFGDIEGYFYNARIDKVTLGSGDYGHTIKVGKLPPLLENLGFDAVINPKILTDKEYYLALNNIISFNFIDNIVCIM